MSNPAPGTCAGRPGRTRCPARWRGCSAPEPSPTDRGDTVAGPADTLSRPEGYAAEGSYSERSNGAITAERAQDCKGERIGERSIPAVSPRTSTSTGGVPAERLSSVARRRTESRPPMSDRPVDHQPSARRPPRASAEARSARPLQFRRNLVGATVWRAPAPSRLRER